MKPPSLQGFLQLLWECIEFVFGNRNDSLDPPVAPETPPVVVVAPKPVIHPDGWCEGTLSDRRAMYALAEKVCAREGLTPELTEDLLSTVWGESGWNQWCVNHKTFDYGIAQFSARYYLKEYKMTPQEALDNPEKCLTIMADNFKAGRQSNWVAYKYRAPYIGRVV